MSRKKSANGLPARRNLVCATGILLLSACAHAPAPEMLTKVQIERIGVPAALLSVEAEPAVPESRMQSAAADYIVHLKINDDVCHQDIIAIAETQK